MIKEKNSNNNIDIYLIIIKEKNFFNNIGIYINKKRKKYLYQ